MDIKKFVKIGRPGYRVTKQRDPENGQQSLLYEVQYSTGTGSFFSAQSHHCSYHPTCGTVPGTSLESEPQNAAFERKISVIVFDFCISISISVISC